MRYILLTIIALFLISAPTFSQEYVGPEKCLSCHNNAGLGDMTGWRTSMHAYGYSVVMDHAHSMTDLLGIVVDYDGNSTDDFKDGLDFNTISSVFDTYKPNAPVLAYSTEGGYTITIGAVTHRVYMTYGGSGLYKQRFIIKINTSEGNSAGYYVSPIQYNEKTSEYVLYHPEAWYDGDNNPIYTPTSTLVDAAGSSRSMVKKCAGCHSNGLDISQDTNGEWVMSGAPVIDEASYSDLNNVFDVDDDGDLDQINTTCERCHGPGSEHASSPKPENIINPKTDLSADQANNLCGMCHSRGKSKPNGTFDYPFHDDTLEGWAVGDLVDDIYTNKAGYYGDDNPDSELRNSKKHHQQFYDLYQSSKPTFEYHKITCFECHDVHNDAKHHVRQEIVEEDSSGAEITVATDNDNNTLCLACHATHGAFEAIPVEWVADYETNKSKIGEVVSAHTKHAYDPDGNGSSRCSKCHNPKTIKSAVNYDIHSHTFEVIPPEKTKLYSMPNACAASCHMKDGLSFGIDFAGDDLGTWDEASDIALADSLMKYYGPGGSWWDHSVSAIDITENEMPTKFSLSQNYPNPFNPTTNIVFDLAQSTKVSLKVYNVAGQLITTLIRNEIMPAGKKLLQFDASNLSAGVYFYTLTTENFTDSKKMILIK